MKFAHFSCPWKTTITNLKGLLRAQGKKRSFLIYPQMFGILQVVTYTRKMCGSFPEAYNRNDFRHLQQKH